jgi:hypothetical protein
MTPSVREQKETVDPDRGRRKENEGDQSAWKKRTNWR